MDNVINKLYSVQMHDSILLSIEADVLNQTVNMKLHLHNRTYTTICFKGVICFNFTGMNLWSNNDRDTILDCYQINDNYIIASIKDMLEFQLRQDSNLTKPSQGFTGKRYDISDCFSIEFLLGSGDKIIIVFETLEISNE
ncbi:MAG: hypothetical protein NC084_02930 [Bacteroides sp.]|nr:hypothetical protein [Eubacterium sp.]MCM1417469.1 hypothetical protein [Roseburia sp.]MCM1461650.1 hypothetical protein [Bacteroides sp.]